MDLHAYVLRMENERRQKRSNDPLIALHLQYAHLRREAGLEALVLTDSTGMVVAGADPWAVCEELAAYAPILSREDDGPSSERIESLREQVRVRSLFVPGGEVLLCSRGEQGDDSLLSRAEVGTQRILAA